MDTRNKIQPAKEPPARLVVGYFDPLHAAHIRRLREICSNGERVSVAVMEPPDPLLPLRARAELLAGLEMVDWVYEAPDLKSFAAADLIDERDSDLQRTNDLKARVVARNRQ